MTGGEPAGRVCVCRCEEVSANEITRAIAEGGHTLNDVKRRTRAGMGACQGIYCLGTIAIMLHDATGVPLREIVPMTTRPPARPVPVAALADLGPQQADE